MQSENYKYIDIFQVNTASMKLLRIISPLN